MTKFEKSKIMSIDEIAEFLGSIDCIDDQPWMSWFNKNFCQQCEPVIGYLYGKEREFAPCEFVDGECPFNVKDIDTKDIVKCGWRVI